MAQILAFAALYLLLFVVGSEVHHHIRSRKSKAKLKDQLDLGAF